MTATISASDGSGTTSPLTIKSPWSTTWQSRNVIHDIVGGGLVVSLVAPRPRAGTFDALYESEAAAFQAVALHQAETSFILTESDRPYLNMTYVVDGDLAVALDEDTLHLWVVTIGYQAVVA